MTYLHLGNFTPDIHPDIFTPSYIYTVIYLHQDIFTPIYPTVSHIYTITAMYPIPPILPPVWVGMPACRLPGRGRRSHLPGRVTSLLWSGRGYLAPDACLGRDSYWLQSPGRVREARIRLSCLYHGAKARQAGEWLILREG